MLEPASENVRLTITGKEGFKARINPDGTIILEGPKEAWPGLAELLIGDFGEEE
jgi:hypothetical protein